MNANTVARPDAHSDADAGVNAGASVGGSARGSDGAAMAGVSGPLSGGRSVALAGPKKIGAWVGQGIVAIALTLVGWLPKLTGDAYSIALFELMNAEPVGRFAVGLLELAVVVLIVIPRTAVYGAALGAVAMLGAIGSHLTVLGIAPEVTVGDEPEMLGMLFPLAIVLLIVNGVVLALRRHELPFVNR